MNPDFAIVLNFNLNNAKSVDFDSLVKKARDIGVRAISASNDFQEACDKYTIKLIDEQNGENLTTDNVINTIVENRKNGDKTVININLEDGKISTSNEEMLEKINSWMHMFGHAFNEGIPSELSVDKDGFVLENRHANYQKYIFLKSPIPEKITVEGLNEEPNRVEWIENRVDLKFNYTDKKLEIELVKPDDEFDWEVIRIQAHRPEDDILETKF